MAAPTEIKLYHQITLIICILGILISFYAYYVETNKELDENYTALCDINEHISCTKAFSSVYGKGFGLVRHVAAEDSIINQPNSMFGIAFYIMQLLLDQTSSASVVKLQITLSILANVGSVYLAYILAFILHDFCFVCVTMYVLNAALLYCNCKRLSSSSQTRNDVAGRKRR